MTQKFRDSRGRDKIALIYKEWDCIHNIFQRSYKDSLLFYTGMTSHKTHHILFLPSCCCFPSSLFLLHSQEKSIISFRLNLNIFLTLIYLIETESIRSLNLTEQFALSFIRFRPLTLNILFEYLNYIVELGEKNQ